MSKRYILIPESDIEEYKITMEYEPSDIIGSTYPSTAINGDIILDNNNNKYIVDNTDKKIPGWLLNFIVKSPEDQNIYDIFSKYSLKDCLIRIGIYTTLVKSINDRFLKSRVIDNVLCNYTESIYVDKYGFDAIHSTLGRISYKTLNYIFQVKSNYTTFIIGKNFQGNNKNKSHDVLINDWLNSFDVLLLVQKSDPVSMACISSKKLKNMLTNDKIKIKIKINGANLTFQIIQNELMFLICPDENIKSKSFKFMSRFTDLYKLDENNICNETLISYE